MVAIEMNNADRERVRDHTLFCWAALKGDFERAISHFNAPTSTTDD